jgi:uncharacterized protein YcfJ
MERAGALDPAGEPHPEREHATTEGSVAVGAVTGGVVGAAAGGPVGAVIGAAVGALAGAGTERVMHGEAGHDHVDGDETHYEGDHAHTAERCEHDHSFH